MKKETPVALIIWKNLNCMIIQLVFLTSFSLIYIFSFTYKTARRKLWTNCKSEQAMNYFLSWIYETIYLWWSYQEQVVNILQRVPEFSEWGRCSKRAWLALKLRWRAPPWELLYFQMPSSQGSNLEKDHTS